LNFLLITLGFRVRVNGRSEVDKFKDRLKRVRFIHDDIVGLEIPMNDVVKAHFVKSVQQL
jgi:hypothetical protein